MDKWWAQACKKPGERSDSLKESLFSLKPKKIKAKLNKCLRFSLAARKARAQH